MVAAFVKAVDNETFVFANIAGVMGRLFPLLLDQKSGQKSRFIKKR
jgi:hypothetical protein